MRRSAIHVAARRGAAMLAAVVTLLFMVVGAAGITATPAAAETYGVSVYTSPSSTTTGGTITWTATNNSSGSAWITLCTGWGGSLVAQTFVSAGGSLSHSVTQYSATSETLVAFVPHESSCTEGYNSSATGTWTAPAATTTTTTTAPVVSYSVSASAANSKPDINTEDLITATNSSGGSEHISLCQSGSASPVAEGIHSPGTALTHDVTSSTAGSQTWYAYAGPSYGCSGASSSVVIDWQNAATVTVSPTAAGTTSGVKNSTTVSWDGAKTGDTLKIVETDHNGTKEFVTKQSNALSSFSGSENFYATETTASGTQWVNDYKAVMYNSSGAVITYAEFSFTWSGTSCASTDQISLAKSSSTTLTASVMTQPTCLPKGTDSLQVYWSPTEPSAGETIPLLTEVGGCPLGTGPTTVATNPCSVTPTSPHNTGWYEAYLIEDLNGSTVVVACSGHVELSVAPTNTYALDLSASSSTPTVGESISVSAGNTSTNPEWLNICGTTGTSDQAAAYKSQDAGISHAETSSTAGTVNYIAYASGSDGCSGTEATVSVTWKAAPTNTSPTTPALSITASNYIPNVGQSISLVLTNQSSGSEWLDYCGTSGTTLTAAGTHPAGGSLTTSVTSSSAGQVTYTGWAGTSEGCSSVEETVTVDWQPAATTTTTAPPSGVTGTSGTSGTTTTTAPPSGTTGTSGTSGTTTTTAPPSSTTTVPPSGVTGTSGTSTTTPVYYPTDIRHPVGWPAGWGVSGPGSMA